jgi:5-methyltetrahydrofolate--homocysteine methyltransferase
LNEKAALVAIREVFEQDGKELPVMISAAVGRGGETMISAQTIEAYLERCPARESTFRRIQLLA